jgi:glycine betaine/proline transport system permease protein
MVSLVAKSRPTDIRNFVGVGSDYYEAAFTRLTGGGLRALSFNLIAALGGPLWAAGRRVWLLFWLCVLADIVGLIRVARGFWDSDAGPLSHPVSVQIVTGAGIILAGRLLLGLLANWFYHAKYRRWRVYGGSSGLDLWAVLKGAILVLFIYGFMVYRFAWPSVSPVVSGFPSGTLLANSVASAIDAAVDWMVVNFEAFFDAVTAIVRSILNFLELVFVYTPWPVSALLIILIAWRVSGCRVTIFTAASLAYLGLFGYWDASMSTIALVASSTVLCVIIGMPIGIWCAKNPRVDVIVRPILDVMQTMPSFVYLVPAIAFFSIGKPPGVLATVIFAVPPMIRLTALGIIQVRSDVREAALAFGANPRQLLLKIELPLAIPSVMTGINQTIMMCLSMVVVAALIGAGGLGDDIVRALRHLETGKGALAGTAIVLCAMILDRIVQGSQPAKRSQG